MIEELNYNEKLGLHDIIYLEKMYYESVII